MITRLAEWWRPRLPARLDINTQAHGMSASMRADAEVDALVAMSEGAQRSFAWTLPVCEQARQTAFHLDAPVWLEMIEYAQIKAGVPEYFRRPSIRDLAAQAWESNKPHLALYSVFLGERDAASYLMRFDDSKHDWARLVTEGLIPPTTFAQRFALDLPNTMLWWDLGLIDSDNVANMLGSQPDLLRAFLLTGRSERHHLFATPGEERVFQPRCDLPNLNDLKALSLQCLLEGHLDAEEFNSMHPRLTSCEREQIYQVYLADNEETWTRYDLMVLGLIDTEELYLGERAGCWQAQDVASHQPIPDELAACWIEEESLTPEQYMSLSVKTWQREDGLPNIHQAVARSAPDVETLLSNLVLPTDCQRRCSYALRMVACHLDDKPAAYKGLAADGEAWQLVLQRRQMPAHFRACQTPLCLGGAACSPSISLYQLDCSICLTTRFLKPPEPLFYALSNFSPAVGQAF